MREIQFNIYLERWSTKMNLKRKKMSIWLPLAMMTAFVFLFSSCKYLIDNDHDSVASSGLALLSLRSRNHARFSLQTVFSITHSDHLIPHIELSAITEIKMFT